MTNGHDLIRTVLMYRDYLSAPPAVVAEKYGVTPSTLYSRFKRAGLPPKQGNGMKRFAHSIELCTQANAERTRVAAETTVARARKALRNAPTEYARGILQLRIDHPTATLAELAALHDPPLTKHAVSSVIRRAEYWVK